MVILKIGDSLYDDHYEEMARTLGLLDVELKRTNAKIAASSDPDTDGLFDAAELLIGTGFVAVQRYLNAIRSDIGLTKAAAYDSAPQLNEEVACARAIHELANYWKHASEWEGNEQRGNAISGDSRNTIRHIERIGNLGDYPCADALFLMVPEENLELSNLLPKMIEWRDHLLRGTPKS